MRRSILPIGYLKAIPIGNLPFGTDAYDVPVVRKSSGKEWPTEVAQQLEALQRRRRARLLELIARSGGQTEAIEALGKTQAQLSQLSTGRKPIGEALARDIEHRAGKPFGWMDTDDEPIARKAAPKHLPDDVYAKKLWAIWPRLSVADQRELYGRAAGFLQRGSDDADEVHLRA
jgi:hypothetical protein